MSFLYAIAVAAYAGCGLYLMLSRHFMRVILGLALMTNGAILMIFFSGRLGSMMPAIIPFGDTALAFDAANSLPQALVLTAIVIAFALTAFTAVLAVAAYRRFGGLDIARIRAAEDLGSPFKPASRKYPSSKNREKKRHG
ncbi:MAG: cation:proton antiporter [Salinarimonadaceae bacterium]|nr:MAG: cation:proton antiporter [Salinarimonadaceae bacterium]